MFRIAHLLVPLKPVSRARDYEDRDWDATPADAAAVRTTNTVLDSKLHTTLLLSSTLYSLHYAAIYYLLVQSTVY